MSVDYIANRATSFKLHANSMKNFNQKKLCIDTDYVGNFIIQTIGHVMEPDGVATVFHNWQIEKIKRQFINVFGEDCIEIDKSDDCYLIRKNRNFSRSDEFRMKKALFEFRKENKEKS